MKKTVLDFMNFIHIIKYDIDDTVMLSATLAEFIEEFGNGIVRLITNYEYNTYQQNNVNSLNTNKIYYVRIF